MPAATNPFPYFPEAATGGYIYIGAANQDAQTNPVTVYRDEARTIPWVQPIRTVDGYPAFQGSSEGIYLANATYSIKVQDRNGNTFVNELLVNTLTSTTGAPLDAYILPSDPRIDGYPDASLAFARAAAVSTVILGTPGAIYYVKDVVLNGRVFDGQSCVLRDAPGARWGIKLNGYAPSLRNVFFQDQGNYVSTTTLASGMTGGSSTAVVTSSVGIEIGDVFFVELDANETRWQTFVTGVAGSNITIRDAVPTAASTGKQVNALTAAVRVGESQRWLIDNVIVINARGALLTMPENNNLTCTKGTITNFHTDGSWYFGWIKAGNTADITALDMNLWGGHVESFNFTGNGTSGPFSFSKRVFLLRDVTVYVNGVFQVFGTNWNYNSQTSIQFLPGHFPAGGASIQIFHFRDGYRGLVDDQRDTAVLSGGSFLGSIRVLDSFVGVACLESELTEFGSLISDGCQYIALQIASCSNTLAFSGETFLGFSGSSLKVFASNPKTFLALYTRRVPLLEQWLAVLDDNIFSDGASDLRISAAGWSGEFQNTLGAGGKFAIPGAFVLSGRNTANLTAGATTFLSPAGAFAAQIDAQQRLINDGTVKQLQVFCTAAPGAGQSYTVDVLLNGASVGQVVISGAASFGSIGITNAFAQSGTTVDLRLVTSAGAAVASRVNVQAVIL